MEKSSEKIRSISGHKYSSKITNHEEIARINNLARESGMTYGQYQAMLYVNRLPKHRMPKVEQCQA